MFLSLGDVRSTGAPIANNCSSSTESTAMARKTEMNEPANHGPPLRGDSFLVLLVNQ